MFTVSHEVTHELEEGFVVYFLTVYGERDDGSEYIAEVDAEIAEVSPGTVVIVGGVPCVPSPSTPKLFYPAKIENPEPLNVDDTHDLRARVFPTREDAEEHVRYTLDRWNNPAPWESFVAL